MRIFIPEIGTRFTLAKDWTFKIINEQRNAGLAKLKNVTGGDYYYPFGTQEDNSYDGGYGYRYSRGRVPVDPGEHTFPAGTSFEVDRIYVRKGYEEFSSVTFKTYIKRKMLRFFARLDDVNKIEF